MGIIKIKFICTRTTHILTYKTKVGTGLLFPSQKNVNQNGKQFIKAPDKLMSSIYLYYYIISSIVFICPDLRKINRTVSD